MYKRIMVGVDDGFESGDVLRSAIELANKFGAQLALCHALDETPLAQHGARVALPDGVAPIEASLRATALEFVNKAADIARAAGLDVEIRIIESEHEHAAELLAKAASDWQADLLVVGTHSRRGMARFLVGSVAEQLVGKASTSLLLVRSQ